MPYLVVFSTQKTLHHLFLHIYLWGLSPPSAVKNVRIWHTQIVSGCFYTLGCDSLTPFISVAPVNEQIFYSLKTQQRQNLLFLFVSHSSDRDETWSLQYKFPILVWLSVKPVEAVFFLLLCMHDSLSDPFQQKHVPANGITPRNRTYHFY